MHQTKRRAINHQLERFAYQVTLWCGSSWAFLFAIGLTLLWLVSGPIFQFSDTWQLVMNTVSSIVTFLMVFLIQRSQNKDSLAFQVKLNELIAATKGASNRLIDTEGMTEEELEALHNRFQMLAEQVLKARQISAAVSIEHTRTKGVEPANSIVPEGRSEVEPGGPLGPAPREHATQG